MGFKPGDAVIHKSDKKLRQMVVAARAVRELPPTNIHNELVNSGRVQDGSYYCTVSVNLTPPSVRHDWS